MKEVLIQKVENGWMVTDGDRLRGAESKIYVFTKWNDLIAHIEDDLIPDDPVSDSHGKK